MGATAATGSAAASPGRILCVCTGNICRSPMVEHLLRDRLAQRGVGPQAILVASAGTGALRGHPVAPVVAEQLAALGIDSTEFAGRALVEPMVAEADLVLTLTRAHRSAVVTVFPRATRWTFTLREFARLLSHLDGAPAKPAADADAPARLRALVAAARAGRGRHSPVAPAEDDVVDPWQRGRAVYDEAAGLIVESVDHIVAALFPQRSPG